MGKYTEKIEKVNVTIDRKGYFYYLKTFEDGLWVCRSPIMNRKKIDEKINEMDRQN